jgi:hypothetical protein
MVIASTSVGLGDLFLVLFDKRIIDAAISWGCGLGNSRRAVVPNEHIAAAI